MNSCKKLQKYKYYHGHSFNPCIIEATYLVLRLVLIPFRQQELPAGRRIGGKDHWKIMLSLSEMHSHLPS